MIVVAGHLVVDPAQRADYLAGCAEVVAQARAARGCLDFAIGPDLVDPARINVYERWATAADVAAFRGSGPGGEQRAAIRAASVSEYDVSAERSLT
ncbi:antibiotic biosynthesis monooxygenase [Nocardia farcinica]|uniref:ABM domain-containing protein n=1 Tax=Nocardia farcinica (strain IFM 10152) TaxID=247156 RepID=Q5YYH5_NOCFA|nr:antibiotic biosynthesis monooxygenase family protein [Nocardia farcinica]MBF6539392.1 antibiotic biosynthesis monooxygenase [Nocardia farcinica]BAD56766.1 hypothetical protein NFA_19200 [Nocardia farcinica IFM 10152]